MVSLISYDENGSNGFVNPSVLLEQMADNYAKTENRNEHRDWHHQLSMFAGHVLRKLGHHRHFLLLEFLHTAINIALNQILVNMYVIGTETTQQKLLVCLGTVRWDRHRETQSCGKWEPREESLWSVRGSNWHVWQTASENNTCWPPRQLLTTTDSYWVSLPIGPWPWIMGRFRTLYHHSILRNLGRFNNCHPFCVKIIWFDPKRDN